MYYVKSYPRGNQAVFRGGRTGHPQHNAPLCAPARLPPKPPNPGGFSNANKSLCWFLDVHLEVSAAAYAIKRGPAPDSRTPLSDTNKRSTTRWTPTRLPPEWEDYGARWGDDGLLYLAEWRRGFTVHELRAMFWTCQQVTTLEADLSAATRSINQLSEQIAQLEREKRFYRQECHRAAKLGLALLPPPMSPY